MVLGIERRPDEQEKVDSFFFSFSFLPSLLSFLFGFLKQVLPCTYPSWPQPSCLSLLVIGIDHRHVSPCSIVLRFSSLPSPWIIGMYYHVWLKISLFSFLSFFSFFLKTRYHGSQARLELTK